MSLEGMYRKGKRSIKKRDASLAKQGTTAGKEVQKKNTAKKTAAQSSSRSAAFRGITDATPTRGVKWQRPTSEQQDAQTGKKTPKKPPQADTLF
jgi:hypothetical protein